MGGPDSGGEGATEYCVELRGGGLGGRRGGGFKLSFVGFRQDQIKKVWGMEGERKLI